FGQMPLKGRITLPPRNGESSKALAGAANGRRTPGSGPKPSPSPATVLIWPRFAVDSLREAPMPIPVRRDERTPLWALTPPPFLSTSTILTPPARASRAPADALEPALADPLHQAIRTLHYTRRTERAYAYWARRFAA